MRLFDCCMLHVNTIHGTHLHSHMMHVYKLACYHVAVGQEDCIVRMFELLLGQEHRHVDDRDDGISLPQCMLHYCIVALLVVALLH